MRIRLILYAILCCATLLYASEPHHTLDDDIAGFISSFITEYDFSQEGRYTHEYHSFILEKTKKSLQDLEVYFQESGFSCPERIVIMGYQKNGVASYYSSQHRVTLKDEASLSSKQGHIVPAHNIFGFLTGFMLKDAQWLQESWFAQKSFFIEHVCTETIELFDDKAYILQKHAFGKDFDALLEYRNRIEKSIKTGHCAPVLKELITFWNAAYQGTLKSCAQETLATQDILFSIDYAQHLLTSSIPVSKIYTGPDITYPIEQLSFQQKEATESAQVFIKKFTDTLQPRTPGKKIAYVFCSFVDGVGKSTLLGNTINYSLYKDDIEHYKRSDNASSQQSTLYALHDDVFVLDLPAQLSHWVSKPDGYVFVDAQSISEVSEIYPEIKTYILANQKELAKNFAAELAAHKNNRITLSGMQKIYFENIITCNTKNPWIFFTYKDFIGVFNQKNPEAIRLLVPFEGVHSKGLKIVETEQMLFSKGLLIPLNFKVFMDDCVKKLKDADIQDIVFVDFLSMYPRSSRENIRVNFLIQQLQKLYPDTFKKEKSLYHTFVHHDIELCHLLKKHKKDFIESLVLETRARAALFSLCTEKMSTTLTTISSEEVSDYIKHYKENVLKNHQEYIVNLATQKINLEIKRLKIHTYHRKYEAFVQFSCNPLYAFSDFMEHLFTTTIKDAYYNDLWNAASKADFKQIHTIAEGCRDQVLLSPILTRLRAQWFSALCNLLHGQRIHEHTFHLEKPLFYTTPLLCKKGSDDAMILLQKILPELDDLAILSQDIESLRLCNNYNGDGYKTAWKQFYGIPHCAAWNNIDTYYGIYGYGFDWHQPATLKKMIENIRKKKRTDGFEEPVIFSSELLDELNASKLMFQKEQIKKINKQLSLKKIKSHSPEGDAIRLWARAIATLEMIIKDPYSVIVTRKNNKNDFAATLQLLEHITLLRSFNIELDGPLFSDYRSVEPVIDWSCLG